MNWLDEFYLIIKKEGKKIKIVNLVVRRISLGVFLLVSMWFWEVDVFYFNFFIWEFVW